MQLCEIDRLLRLSKNLRKKMQTLKTFNRTIRLLEDLEKVQSHPLTATAGPITTLEDL